MADTTTNATTTSTNNSDTSKAIAKAGYSSAAQIANTPKSEFVKSVAPLLNSNPSTDKTGVQSATAQAEAIHNAAVSNKTKAVLAFTNLVQQNETHYKNARFANLNPANSGMNDLPNYNELFGNVDFCACESCRSILSPAAYFVDLMRTQDKYITPLGNDTTYDLKNRRPDLWNVELSCVNTTTELSKLEIANDVLADQLQLAIGSDPIETLANLSYPWNLPYNQPLHQIQTVLKTQKTSLATIWKNLNAADSVAINCEILGVSPKQWASYETPTTTASLITLAANYGVKTLSADFSELTPVNNFLLQSNLTRAQLDNLFVQGLSDAEQAQGLQNQFFINGGSEAALTVNTTTDTIQNLSVERLDRINRFVRLSMALGWSFVELDWSLRTIARVQSSVKTTVEPAINAAMLPYLAWMKQTQVTLKCSALEVAGFLGALKNEGLKNGPTFFQQVFQNQNIINPPIWSASTLWNVPQLGSSDTVAPEDHQIQAALAAALKISQDDLIRLTNVVITNSPSIFTAQKFPLSPENLSVLYRLSHLPKLTGLSIAFWTNPSLIPSLKANFAKVSEFPGKEAHLGMEALETFTTWLATSPFSAHQLQYILTGESISPVLQNQVFGTDTVTNFTNSLTTALAASKHDKNRFLEGLGTLLSGANQKQEALTLFANLQKAGIVSGNYYVVTSVPTVVVLLKQVQTAMISLSASQAQEVTNLAQSLLEHDYTVQQQVFTQHLGGLCGISHQLIPYILDYIPLNLLDILSDDADNMTNLQLIQRYVLFAQLLKISPADAKSIKNNPGFYGITSLNENTEDGTLFTEAEIETMVNFKALITEFNDTQNHFLHYFIYAAENTVTADDAAARLAKITQWDPNQIKYLINELSPPPSGQYKHTFNTGTVAGVYTLKLYFDQAAALGIDVRALVALKNLNDTSTAVYQDYVTAGGIVWAGMQQNSTSNVITGVANLLNQTKRNVFVPLVIDLLQKKGVEVKTPRDLYGYLLIDVEVQGVVQTSRVKEAISAVQLYIYQTLNNLNPGTPIVSEELPQWWTWMEHYRTWQANREVFLYPENYIEPQLRKNKSPQFAQLESDLVQTNFKTKASSDGQPNRNSADAADKPFKKYMDGFATVADLEIIGSTAHDINNGGTITREVCFVGQSRKTPETYYYMIATFTNTSIQPEAIGSGSVTNEFEAVEWTPWQPITCHMQPAGVVSPVFAFGRLYLFWVEKLHSGSESVKDASNKKYTATIRTTYLNFNDSWTGAENVKEITGILEADLSTDLSVYPMMIHSLNQLVMSFQPNVTATGITVPYPSIGFLLAPLSTTSLIGGAALKTSKPSILTTPVSGDMAYTYYNELGSTTSFDTSVATVSVWVNLSTTPEKGTSTTLLATKDHPNLITINDQLQLGVNNEIATSDQWNIGQWNHISVLFNQVYKIPTSFKFDYKWELLTDANLLDSSGNAYFMNGDEWYAVGFDHQDSLEDHHFDWWKRDGDTFKPSDHFMLDNGITAAQTKTGIKKGKLVPSVLNLNDKHYMAYLEEASGHNLYSDIAFAELSIDQAKFTPKDIVDTSGNRLTTVSCVSLANLNGNLGMAWVNKENEVSFVGTVLDSAGQFVTQLTPISLSVKSARPVGIAGLSNKVVIAYGSDASTSLLTIGVVDTTTNVLTQVYTGTESIGGTENISGASFVNVGEQLWVVWLDANTNVNFAEVVVPDTGQVTLQNHRSTNFKTSHVQGVGLSATEFYMIWNTSSPDTQANFFNVDVTDLPEETVAYLNGVKQDTNLLPAGVVTGPFTLGSTAFEGTMQEVLFFDTPCTDAQLSLMFEHSNENITNEFNFGVLPGSCFNKSLQNSPLGIVPVVGLPSWNVVKRQGAEYLLYPYQQTSEGNTVGFENCIRLNSTAVHHLSQILLQQEVSGLLSLSSQSAAEIPFANMGAKEMMLPSSSWPSDTIEFFKGPMANYYWEIFFYAPYLVANTLQRKVQYKEAKSWYEYIFDPSIASNSYDLNLKDQHPNDKFWRFIGLRQYNNQVLDGELSDSTVDNYATNLTNPEQLFQYLNDPFDPQTIARLRPIAYQKSIVMSYVNNLITWGDSLFKLYTIEDINEAEMLYVMAYDLLGKKSDEAPAPPLPEIETLEEILDENKKSLGGIHEFLVNVQNQLPTSGSVILKDTPANYIPGDYFGIPENEHFKSYWSTVQTRIHDIRNGLNIQGKREQPPLFEPPINPMELVAAIASGESLEEALNPLMSTIPFYRFQSVIQRAKEVTGTVVQLGNALLSALEQKDGAALQAILNTNEQEIEAMNLAGKQENIKQVDSNIAGLVIGLASATSREAYYIALSLMPLNPEEIQQLALNVGALEFQIGSQELKVEAAIANMIPTVFGFSDGNFQPGAAVSETAGVMDGVAGLMNAGAGISGTLGNYIRREEDWVFQAEQAGLDIVKILNELNATKYQKRIIEQEMSVTKTRIDHQKKVATFMKNKFTDEQLYDWMIGRVSAMYFQAYKFAMELATQAQNAWVYEKGLEPGDITFLQPGQWNNLHQGLLAGQSLMLSLERMDAAYAKQDERRLEIKKTVAISTLSTGTEDTLIGALNKNGACGIILDQALFDKDYPTHYCRQIKSVAISIPAVVGPYEDICATLIQTSNSMTPMPRGEAKTDLRVNQQIAISNGVNDTGMFELNFNDPRYLPFEGTGAVSNWTLSINKELQGKISEVILEMRYTALYE